MYTQVRKKELALSFAILRTINIIIRTEEEERLRLLAGLFSTLHVLHRVRWQVKA
jgi:hypothetical protein